MKPIHTHPPALLILLGLASGMEHGHAVMRDIEASAASASGRAAWTARWSDSSGQQRVDARQVGKHAPAADDEGQDRNSERLEVGPMDQTTAEAGGETLEMRDGEDFVCPNCGCEIMLKHHGDPAKMPEMGAFRCCCGTAMHPEHPREH